MLGDVKRPKTSEGSVLEVPSGLRPSADDGRMADIN